MKYCPLCAGEYRDTASTCSSCGVALVESLSEACAAGKGSRLLWEGTERREFNSVVRALQGTEIPAHMEEGVTGVFAKLANPNLRIRVMYSDFDRALALAAEASANRQVGVAPMQTCHACLGECSAALAACPQCKAVLRVEHQKDKNPRLAQKDPPATIMRYCPLCDAEYGKAHERCTVCGVDLIAEELRGRPLDDHQRKERIVVVWRSGDPVAVSEVIETLRSAGIRHHVQPTNDHLAFELAMPRPKYAVRVFASDAANAKLLLADIRESSPFAPDIDDAKDVPAPLPDRPKHEWNAAAATLEIWNGEDAALAELLVACLRENQIGVRREGAQPGMLRLLVMPADESFACEIIREVREATPPL